MSQKLAQAISNAVERSFKECYPVGARFAVLRETGLVAVLRGQLLSSMKDEGLATTAIASMESPKQGHGKKKYERFTWATGQHAVCAVQLEMKLKDAEYERNRNKGKDRSDVVVLHPEVKLECARNGPGDVLASIDADHVAAVIEVKASPSVEGRQLPLYAKDIRRLLDYVQQKTDVRQGHFVLADKSDDLFGTWTADAPEKRAKWPKASEASKCLCKLAGPNPGKDLCIAANGIAVWAEVPPDVPAFVTLHLLDSSVSGVRVLYAYRDARACACRTASVPDIHEAA